VLDEVSIDPIPVKADLALLPPLPPKVRVHEPSLALRGLGVRVSAILGP
jgi:hypothetical protein